MKMVGLLAAALMSLGVSAQRVDTVLADGWTANGVAVTLPHTWNAVDAADGPSALDFSDDSVHGIGYRRQAVIYRRALPSPKVNRRYYLRFEGASLHAKVVVNGYVVGVHACAQTGFTFEITDFLRLRNNELEVLVDNFYDATALPISGDYSLPGGLYRPVHLIETPKICLDPAAAGSGPGVVVMADAETGRVTMRPFVSRGKGAETNDVSVGYEIVETGLRVETNELTVSGFKLWTPETPNLYRLKTTVTSAFGIDTVVVPFGFAKHELRADGYYLNGVKRKLRGVNFHQDVEGKGWALASADEERAIAMIRKMGADAVRTAHYPHSQHVYDLCDREGLVAWIELPVTDFVNPAPTARATAVQAAKEMVAQNRHHPSAAFWSIANEVRGAKTQGGESALVAVLAELRDAIRSEDATRPVVQANFIAGQTNVIAVCKDFGYNTYPGWYFGSPNQLKKQLDEFFGLNPQLTTIALSEYGAGANVGQHENPAPERCENPDGPWHPEEYQTRHHVEQYRTILAEDRLWGSFVWQMFDSAADVRTDGPVKGINDKGLVGRDHVTVKDAYFFYKANWNSEPLLHLCGKRMAVTTNAVVEVIAFSNVGEVTLKVNGQVIDTKTPDAVKTVRWPEVPLTVGVNTIKVISGGRADSCRWERRKHEDNQ